VDESFSAPQAIMRRCSAKMAALLIKLEQITTTTTKAKKLRPVAKKFSTNFALQLRK
jgi:ribosomal protein L17